MRRGLRALETKVDERLLDTRPIWERALAEIGELRTTSEQVNKRLDELRTGQYELRTEQDQIRTGLEQLHSGQEKLGTGQDQLRTGLDQLRTDLREEMKIGFHKFERQLMRLSKDFLEFRAEHDMLEDRIEKLEPQPT